MNDDLGLPSSGGAAPIASSVGTDPALVVTTFDDLLVTPYTELLDLPSGLSDHRGGPHWPDWDHQTVVRHQRQGVPVDERPHPAEDAERLPGILAWAGPIEYHFGHMLADFSMRITSTLTTDPDATMAFSSHPRCRFRSMADTPRWFQEILAWLDLPLERTVLITRPSVVEHLLVLPQAEQHKGPGPSPAHLDRMDALVERRMPRRTAPTGVLFVSRAGQHARLAGEVYLEEALARSGVRVIRPEDEPVAKQLAAYVGADTILFSQGSAVHGARLLGRTLGDVVVINRMATDRIAEAALAPRARSLTYRDAVIGVVCGLMAPGEPFEVLGISILDEERLLDDLAPIVPGLRAHWRAAAYHAARDRDVLEWFERSLPSPRVNGPGSWEHMLDTLGACGMTHLRSTVESMMEQHREAMESETTAVRTAGGGEPAPASAAAPTSEPAPSGTGGPPPGIDPSPTPIAWHNLWRWAKLTYKAERRYYRRLGRGRTLTSARLAASILPPIRRPVFIIGAARSGTTFLGDCMGRLPELSYHHEPPATKAAGRHVYEGLWSYQRARFFFRSVYAWLLRVELDGGLRFCEKTPTNALLIPFLARAFPDAQFVHIIRDGRDASASLYKQPWLRGDAATSGKREPGGYLHGPWAPWWVEKDRVREFEVTSDAHRMIWAWRRYTQAALRDGPPLGPARYHELRYESFVTDPRGEATRVLDFLGISRPSSRNAFLDAADRASEGSMGSWRRTFSAAELAQIEADSGDLLRSLGYGD